MIPRYILSRLEHVFDALEELAGGAYCPKKTGAALSLIIQILLSCGLAYVLSIWPVWCVLRYFEYTAQMETGRMAYAVTGFLCCEYALGKMAKAFPYRGFFMSVFHYTIAMGAYVVLTLNPKGIADAYPWLMRLMGAGM